VFGQLYKFLFGWDPRLLLALFVVRDDEFIADLW
jgi:hypothetical protein